MPTAGSAAVLYCWAAMLGFACAELVDFAASSGNVQRSPACVVIACAADVATVVEAIRHLLYQVKSEQELLLLSGRSDEELQRGRTVERLVRELLSQRTEEVRPLERSVKAVFAMHDALTRCL